MSKYEHSAADRSANKGVNASHSDIAVLIQDCIAGELSAQKKLYEQYAPFVFGIIRKYMRETGPAEEILNDVFLKVFTRLSQYSFQGPFEGWIYRITINAVTYYIRRNLKHKNVVYKEELTDDAVVSANAVQHLSFKEILELVHSIPDTQRIVFNLFVFEQYSHREIASALNISEGSSRWYLNDARKRLKEKINLIMKQ